MGLQKGKCALLIIDMQPGLLDHLPDQDQFLQKMIRLVRGWQALSLQLFVTEQYPEGLGSTHSELTDCFSSERIFPPKTTFSCLEDPKLRALILNQEASQWVVVGLEAHLCVLLTAKDLKNAGKEVVVLQDGIASLSAEYKGYAIEEMREFGIRISNSQTVLFELLQDAKAFEFKVLKQLWSRACVC